jgi:hypothetical protein
MVLVGGRWAARLIFMSIAADKGEWRNGTEDNIIRHRSPHAGCGHGGSAGSRVDPRSLAQQNPVTAIDIALEPDATMVQHAKDANARLLKSFPKGFALDETHHPHVSVLQQFVRTDDFDKIFAAANAIMVKERPTASLTLTP